ncbi:U4/U6-U5 snRNP complex subunit PRP31 [Lachancea thermotolerans CBS 6340]|uniref:KLTH0F12034p n=1 Tax=Lachancea thermotolerans (strain ATCC 56472 / CBS 6340 / NRRL Y-8284) TaxID=559295 RepID=C5DLD3_LACTC|nr:KLTH0F12034p [Lachancea thermotolerans CBS 6340]CAR24284.1 KLTH0F12034p [Lachancea thermotolerans CBS 6340]
MSPCTQMLRPLFLTKLEQLVTKHQTSLGLRGSCNTGVSSDQKLLDRMDDEDLLNDLNDDFPTTDESEGEEIVHDGSQENTGGEIRAFLDHYEPYAFSKGQPGSAVEVSKVYAYHVGICRLMDEKSPANAMLLSLVQPVIQQEVSLLRKLIASIYDQKFPELESLIASANSYAKVVRLLETKGGGKLELQELQDTISREQLLVLSMAMHTGFRQETNLAPKDSELLMDSINVLLELCDLQDSIAQYVASLISQVAPNLCALVGPATSAALIAAAGGLLELSEMPSCNLASIGNSKRISSELDFHESGVRQRGHIYHSSLVSGQPVTIQKQALRMVCAKVSLCVRVDVSKNSPGGELGLKWRQDVLKRLRGLLDPPNLSNTKALPVPEDKPKKKRAGKRFRKYKEQFQLSHVRQLQNRMEFGKQESTTMDVFGEEIGMGMANTVRAAFASSSANNKAKLRKSMQHRVAAESQSTQDFLTLDDRSNKLMASAPEKLQNTEKQDKKAPSNTENEWYLKLLQGKRHTER